MKMDDSFESEVISDVLFSHFQMLKKFASVLYVNMFNIFILAPGETLQSKMLRPAPFMIFMLLLILVSIVIQSNTNLRNYIMNIQSAFTALTPGDGLRFSNLADGAGGLASLSTITNSVPLVQEVKEGLVGIYAMQGRRGQMEDRFCVLQDVSVGPNKTMSFFGVYDGHGGQFVAEYLRVHLFANTVEKIKQLRAAMNSNGFMQDSSSSSSSSRPIVSDGKQPSVKRKAPGPPSATVSRSDSIKSTCSTTSVAAGNDKDAKENGDDKSSASADAASDKSTDGTASTLNDEPLKKDDAYNTLNIRKKSLANINAANSSPKEDKSDNGCFNASDDTHQYVDMNKNINYTKLLTDQILNIDSQVVEHCKSHTDLSGSTAVVAVLDGELLVVGNVGDSRAVMADDRGRAIPLSFDHKPNQLKERRRIKEAGGFITFTGVWRVAGILATSRALGDFPLKHPRPLVTAEPDILTFSLHDHKAEFVILATDGLWDVLSNEEAVAYVRAHLQDPDFGAKSVAQHAYALGSQDNITVAIINFTKMNKNR